MSKVNFIFTIMLLNTCILTKGQLIYLSGVVKIAGTPVKGLTVYSRYASTTTDNFGRYNLPLNGCANCKPGGSLELFTYHLKFGSGTVTCIVSNDFTFDFSIKRNPEHKYIYGSVINEATGLPLSGMLVKMIASQAGEDIPAVATDSFGQFRIGVENYELAEVNAVRLQVIDPAKQFRTVESTPDIFTITAFNIIKMEGRKRAVIHIQGYTTTKICVQEGDDVLIEAGGQVKIGNFVGNSDPDGRQYGLFGLSLSQYCLVGGINSSALIYRIGGDDAWKLAGKRKHFIAERNGCIEFEINEKDKSDNEGYYEAEVTVRHE